MLRDGTNFFFYASTRAIADRVAEQIDGELQVTVRPAAKGDDWLILASLPGRISDEQLDEFEDRFGILASKYGVEYDGYDRPV